MKWLHPIGSVRGWLRWREGILVAQEDAAIRAARERASGADRAYLDTIVELRARNARAHSADSSDQ